MAVAADILSMSALQNDSQNARREPVDNGDQIGKVLALRPPGYLCGRQKFRRLNWASGKPALEAPAMPFPRASKALSRFTVLDLTRVRSGPTCVRQLADWGANVIKIETPAHLDTGEPLGGPRDGPDFMNLHRNKRSITLNLKAPEGVAALKKMVKKADVVGENFRPDVKERLGIDYKALRKVNPRIIYASISGFGQTGPYAERPGFDQIAQGM